MFRRRTLFWLHFALCLLAVAGLIGLYAWKWRRESAVAAFIRALPGSVNVERVEADLLSDNYELTKLAGRITFLAEAPFDIRIEKLRVKGMNMRFAQTKGKTRIAEALYIDYLSFVPGENCARLLGYSFMNAGSFDIRGLWMDWSSLQQAAVEGPRSKAFADFLLSLQLGPTVVMDAGIKFTPIAGMEDFGQTDFLITLGRWEMESYSLISMGHTSNRDFSLIYANGSRFTAREMDFTAYAAPEHSLRTLISDAPTPPGPEQAKALLREGYSLRGVFCRDAVFMAADGDKVAVPGLRFDLDVGNGKLFFNLQAPKILFSGKLLAASLLEGVNRDGKGDEALGGALDGEIKASLDMELKTEAMHSGGVRVLFSQDVDLETLGSLDLHFSLHGVPPSDPERALPVNPATVRFDWGRLKLEDAGFLEKYYQAAALAHGAEGKPQDRAAALRSQDVSRWRKFAATMQPSYQEALLRFADFLEKSGSCTLRVVAVKPVDMLRFTELIGDPAYLLLEAERPGEAN